MKALYNETESLLLGRVSVVSPEMHLTCHTALKRRRIMSLRDSPWLTVFLLSQQLDPPEEEQLSSALQSVELELGKLGEIPWLYHILQPNDEEVSGLKAYTCTHHFCMSDVVFYFTLLISVCTCRQ